ncbi:UDP-3-O-(3-hydroxymyristoyl)glucosamine N-acyltransferase [Picosynechococcus sp. PCC 11901]|uniref:UDP-3-O-(3-hydroxymyristoyl)glucosamine N-acyltransferase n=1 Tax=Picosynechococcus sp. PCC 11901 TaxID=2579791 RepID=UPI0010FBEDC6|nr:UDP-3-O-(3-hydroxymyristoyl)glucosamine N-acyltransferase [Picosynechococcus sp. PCC 11901]QCS49691.1 UDP-3-O-(3-hydroxymyristoyl)glucosamine N-acyltransferase [Picosynechococcus sp. PCC 11901]
MNVSELIQVLKSDLIIDHSLGSDPEITGVAAIDAAKSQEISYIEGGKFAARVDTTAASALILPADEDLQQRATARGLAWLSTKEPRLLFAAAIKVFYQPFRPAPGIHPTAVIDPSVQLGEAVSVGAHVVLYPGVKIGDRTCIMANAVIYPDVEIGADTLLHANCTIHERVKIGNHCVIHSGAVIGAEGFGFVPTAQGWFKMEQSGIVVLEDGVEIGCNSAVDRPAVGETRIKTQTKLDNLVHVAHGGTIGSNCALAAQVGLAGGVTVGNNVLLGGQVGVANQAVIGDGAIATAQTGINNRVAPGEIVSGSPAVPNAVYRKVSAIYKRLPEMYEVFRKLKRG